MQYKSERFVITKDKPATKFPNENDQKWGLYRAATVMSKMISMAEWEWGFQNGSKIVGVIAMKF